MSDFSVRILVWFALIAHVTVGVVSWRRGTVLPLVPIVNLLTASGVVAYALQRWYGVFAHGIIWYGTDQLLPLYALVVCIFSVMSLLGKVVAAPLHWTILVLHLLVVIAAVLFVTFFKMTRMI
ncbi:MAG: hypothetical protein ABJB74_05590 [Gemmatimonas sp.]